jgi:hypothetical protein
LLECARIVDVDNNILCLHGSLVPVQYIVVCMYVLYLKSRK